MTKELEKNKQIEQFNQLRADSLKIVDEVKDLSIKNINDKIGYEAVRAGKMRLAKQMKLIKDTRLGMTRGLDEIKAGLMKLEKGLVEDIEPTKQLLSDKQKTIDELKVREARKVNLPDKIEKLKEIGATLVDNDALLEMGEIEFSEFYSEKKEAYLEEKERKIKEDQDKKDAELKKKQEEIEQKEREAKIKKQAELDAKEAEKTRIELAEKQVEIDKQKLIDDAETKRLADIKKVEDEKQAIIDAQKEKELEEKREKERDAQIRAEGEAKLLSEQAELEKKKKYINWLKKNKCEPNTQIVVNSFQEDDFVILRNADKFIMYKKIDNIIIK